MARTSDDRPSPDRPHDTEMEFDFGLVARQLRRARKRRKKSQPNVNKLSSSIESITYDDTIEGSSTLIVRIADTEYKLWHFFDIDKNGKLDVIDVNYPDDTAMWWRMTQFGASTQDGYLQLELTFMERPAVLLMKQHGPRHASRGRKTRAEFFKALVETAAEKSLHPMKLYSYELHKKQPIYGTGDSVPNTLMAQRLAATDPLGIGGAMPPADPPTAQPVPDSEPNSAAPQHKKDKDRRDRKQGGIPMDADLDVKGIPAKKEQKKQMERALDVAFELNAPKDAVLCMLRTALAESGFKAVMNYGGSPYGGVFQGDVRGGTFALDDTEAQAKCFLKGGKGFQGGGAIHMVKSKDTKDWPLGKICYTIQGNLSNFDGGPPEAISFFTDYPINSHNGRFADEANAIYDAYGGDFSGGPTYRRQEFNYEIGTEEDPYESYWDGMTRLASDVGWRLFINGKIVYFDDDMRLIKQKPALILHRDSARLISWDATWDARKMASEVRLELIASPFEFRAGDVFWLKEFGPLSRASSAKPDPLPGRWLVTDISRDSGSYASSITLAQPKRPKKEPAADIVQLDPNDPNEVAPVGGGIDDITSDSTPKEIIDEIVIPLCKRYDMNSSLGTPINAADVTTANHNHGPTSSGGHSDHQGPPESSWAVDIFSRLPGGGNNQSPDKAKASVANALARKFEFPVHSNHVYQFGIDDQDAKGFHFQLGYLVADHYNHVHFGVKKL